MTTFIFGHKNPDTDSVCSAIALSYLKNQLGDKTVPKVLGNINNETKYVLDYFNIEQPSYLNDVRVRIKNVKYDKKAFINEKASIYQAFNLMRKQNITAIPLVDDNKYLTGFVTLKELARYLIADDKEYIDTSLNNIVDVLDAKEITKYDKLIKGKIMIAGMKSDDFFDKVELTKDDILIVGDRHKILDYAIDSKVKLIILPFNSTIDEDLLQRAKKNNITIIESKYSSYEIANKIYLSNYIKNINSNNNPYTVNNEDYYTDFKSMTHQVNYTNYPVINNKGMCLGLIRLTGPNDYEKQKVILVDHNNLDQSVEGIEEADILEIIDHHNLGAIGTKIPINFRSMPVGCTATMVYDMYVDNNVEIPKDIAGIMLSAIISDTLILTSPTTTKEDRKVANILANIAEVNIQDFGYQMIKAASSIKNMTTEEIIMNDFKKYNVNNRILGIGQIMTMDFDIIEPQIDKYIDRLENMAMNEYSIVVLFVTDIIKKGSYIIYNKDAESTLKEAFSLKEIEQGIFIPNMLSRKKQLLPCILSVMDSNSN